MRILDEYCADENSKSIVAKAKLTLNSLSKSKISTLKNRAKDLLKKMKQYKI